jgi:BirA family biotin operon repressor/biotin-[acetyl-CoA-carboxylase] ligase
VTPNEPLRLEQARAAELGLPGFEVWESLASTNDRARTLAECGTRRGWLVVAQEQSAGRGRRGATWTSIAGEGVWMSMVLGRADAVPQLPILIGVACAETLQNVADVDVHVKWPNDLLLDDRKVGGILVERGRGWVVAGVGINVGRAPPHAEVDGDTPVIRPTSLFEHTSQRPTLLTLAGELARHILGLLDAEDRVPRTLEAFAARDALARRRVWTEEHGPGMARGLDEDGMLLLELDDGTVRSVRSGRVRLTPQPGWEE